MGCPQTSSEHFVRASLVVKLLKTKKKKQKTPMFISHISYATKSSLFSSGCHGLCNKIIEQDSNISYQLKIFWNTIQKECVENNKYFFTSYLMI